MYNCLFTAHCTELCCDKSCPIYAEVSYLLERNKLTLDATTTNIPTSIVLEITQLLSQSDGGMGVYVVSDTIIGAERLTYVAICHNWERSQLHCTVYNLNLSWYLEELKRSWNTHSESEELEYCKIWSKSAKVLVISGIDYINFGDFESQTLLALLQARQMEKKTTIIVSPPLDALISTKPSAFYNGLRQKLTTAVKVVSKS